MNALRPRRGTVRWLEAQDPRVVRNAARSRYSDDVPVFVSEIVRCWKKDGDIRNLCREIEKEIGREGQRVDRLALRQLDEAMRRERNA